MVRLWCRALLIGCLLTAAGCHGSRPLRDPTDQRSPYAATSSKAIIALGQRLFFDPQLSGSGRTACATCHNPDFAYGDPRPVSISDNGRPGLRHAPSLLNVGFRPHLMWDGRFDSLEEQAFGPFRPDGEMGIDIEGAAALISRNPAYRQQFSHAFGQPPSPEGIVTAVAAFERTLVIGNSRFDRFVFNKDERALAPLEKYGLEVFTSRGHCVRCHAIYAPRVSAFPLFTDFGFHNLGIGFTGFTAGSFRDPGRGAVTSVEKDYGAFRTPSLRNVAVTGPFMHDGSLRTLDEVIAFYDAGGQPNPNQSPILQPLGLTDQEKNGLVAFLDSLTDLEHQTPTMSRAPSESDAAQVYER
jgi:cytochrome c peroxidase